MKLIALLYPDEILIFPIPFKDIADEDIILLTSSLAKKTSIELSITLPSDISKQEEKELIQKTSQNYGHDLISPIVIQKKSKRINNLKSFQKMIDYLKSDEESSHKIKEIDLGIEGVTGVIISI